MPNSTHKDRFNGGVTPNKGKEDNEYIIKAQAYTQSFQKRREEEPKGTRI